MIDNKRVCKNCADFDDKESVCTIRFTRVLGKGRTPMKKKPNYKGCIVFMAKV